MTQFRMSWHIIWLTNSIYRAGLENMALFHMKATKIKNARSRKFEHTGSNAMIKIQFLSI